jgi:hypothetical protein
MFTLTLPRGYAYEEFAGTRIVCYDVIDRVLCHHILVMLKSRMAEHT